MKVLDTGPVGLSLMSWVYFTLKKKKILSRSGGTAVFGEPCGKDMTSQEAACELIAERRRRTKREDLSVPDLQTTMSVRREREGKCLPWGEGWREGNWGHWW